MPTLNPTISLTSHHAKYFAWELTRRRAASEEDRLSQSIFDASVDLNPHQIDAALFALQNPLSRGVILADEVGLGKTIEAALVLCQLWAERRRRLLVICPAALRKQWAQELSDKFNLPTQVLDARTWKMLRQEGIYDPLDRDVISIMSLNFAARMEEQLGNIPWDLVAIDEAHKLRNAHRKSNETGQSLKRSLAGRRKLLLTATPLQNSLMELYGLSSLIDEDIFGDERSFRAQYSNIDADLAALRRRLHAFIKRTLRKDVLEYVPYTQRHALTTPFTPSDDEQGVWGATEQKVHLSPVVASKPLWRLVSSEKPPFYETVSAIAGKGHQHPKISAINPSHESKFVNSPSLTRKINSNSAYVGFQFRCSPNPITDTFPWPRLRITSYRRSPVS